jgi:antitoxin component YwqK of YwqJK toxin-antitoxin module
MNEKFTTVVHGFTIKLHANGTSVWSKGKMVNNTPHGYWEWYRVDGTKKRSGHFEHGVRVGEWITYDSTGAIYKITRIKPDKPPR